MALVSEEELCPICWRLKRVCRAASTDPDCQLPLRPWMDYLTRRIRENAGCSWFNPTREEMLREEARYGAEVAVPPPRCACRRPATWRDVLRRLLGREIDRRCNRYAGHEHYGYAHEDRHGQSWR